jgi:uncharacterized protein YndB with AHSA1/START domain
MGPSVSREIASPPETAWRLLTHVDEWARWGPTVAGGTVDGGVIGPGARGTVRTVVGVSLPFVVTAFEPGRSWAWSVAGIPATRHRVTPTDGGCVVSFEVPWWAPGYLAVCALALLRIERLAAAS